MLRWLFRHFGGDVRVEIVEPTTSAKKWDDRTREEKRLIAPYALGWEEGYACAYEIWCASGKVSTPDYPYELNWLNPTVRTHG